MSWLRTALLPGVSISTGDCSRSIVVSGSVRVVHDNWRAFGHGASIYMSRSMVVRLGSGRLQCAGSIAVVRRLSSHSPLFGKSFISVSYEPWMSGLTWLSLKVNRNVITCRIFTLSQCQNVQYVSKIWRWKAGSVIRRKKNVWTRAARLAIVQSMHQSRLRALQAISEGSDARRTGQNYQSGQSNH